MSDEGVVILLSVKEADVRIVSNEGVVILLYVKEADVRIVSNEGVVILLSEGGGCKNCE